MGLHKSINTVSSVLFNILLEQVVATITKFLTESRSSLGRCFLNGLFKVRDR